MILCTDFFICINNYWFLLFIIDFINDFIIDFIDDYWRLFFIIDDYFLIILLCYVSVVCINGGLGQQLFRERLEN